MKEESIKKQIVDGQFKAKALMDGTTNPLFAEADASSSSLNQTTETTPLPFDLKRFQKQDGFKKAKFYSKLYPSSF